MKRILITGASGFIGNNLARFLMREGHAVHLFVRPGHTAWRLADIAHAVYLHQVDLLEKEAVYRAVHAIRPEWIFHLATYGAYSSQTDAERIVRTNVLGTAHLVLACLETGFEAFVNTGSSSEYGFKDHAPAETEGLDPNSYYAVAKASATIFCRYTAQHHRVHLVTLRLYSIYGPYEEPTRLIPTLLMYGFAKRWPPLVAPDIARDYTYVEDVNRAYLLAATVPPHEWGAIYNVGTGVQTSLRQVAEVARHSLQIPAEPVWGTMANRSWDTTTWVANNQAIQQHLGWRPAYDFARGLQQTIDWFQSNPAMQAWYQSQQQRTTT